MSVFITGDIHREIYPRFSFANFPCQRDLTKNDYVIVVGDFGIPWCNDKTDAYCIKELDKRPFTTLFIDGNHENFNLLNGYHVETWNGGNVHRISDSVIHLMRGQVFKIQGHKFWTFGGASSHDISDGLFDYDDPQLHDKIKRLRKQGKNLYRIRNINWWEDEMPNQHEYDEGWENLKMHDFKVDFVLTHCPPTSILRQIGFHDSDAVSDYLQKVKQMTDYKQWYFGHMHMDMPLYWDRTIGIYQKISQIL